MLLMKFLFLLLSLPLLYWQQGAETAPQLKQAGIEQIAVAPEKYDEWRTTGLAITKITELEINGRTRLLVPGVQRRVNVASPTRAPWIDANGWRLTRKPAAQYFYEVPAGRASLAVAEAFAYGIDAVLKIDPSDMAEFGKMMAFVRQLPTDELQPVADIGLIEDQSVATGEIMNLLTRRNLLFQLTDAPSSALRVNIKVGSKDYSLDEAADPSAFVQKVRKQLGDENRSLRIYGSETVIAHVIGNSDKIRLHLLNYSGRNIEGLRIKLKGKFASKAALAYGVGNASLEDFSVANGATEFTLPQMTNYVFLELPRTK